MPYCRNCGNQLQETDNFCEACGTARREVAPKVTYIGKTCPFCQFPLKADSEVVKCPACKVLHHRECWLENSGCTTFGCRETTYQSAAGDRLEISFDEPSCRDAAPASGGDVNKLLAAALVITLLAFTGLFLTYINMLNNRSGGDEAAIDLSGDDAGMDEAVPEEGTEEAAQTYDPAVIAGLDADYYIDYENGTITIGDLPVGARVVDPGWEWEFRTRRGYAREEGDQTKPVTWIVVAKDRYEGLESHVTLLSEELIGLHAFDNSTHVTDYGYNRWGASGTVNADRGLRPWLNSSVIHSGEGFYRAFSESFTGAVLTTTVPNKEWESGSAYSTQDKVFIPSTTELGDTEHNRTYRIGSAYPYFQGADDAKRIARLAGETKRYWSRSPDSGDGYSVRRVATTGAFDGRGAHGDINGVRPALNLKSGILVSEINP